MRFFSALWQSKPKQKAEVVNEFGSLSELAKNQEDIDRLKSLKKDNPKGFQDLTAQKEFFDKVVDRYEQALVLSVTDRKFFASYQHDLTTLLKLQSNSVYTAFKEDRTLPLDAMPAVDLLASNKKRLLDAYYSKSIVADLKAIKGTDIDKFDAITLVASAEWACRYLAFSPQAKNPMEYLSKTYDSNPQELLDLSSRPFRLLLREEKAKGSSIQDINRFITIYTNNPAEFERALKKEKSESVPPNVLGVGRSARGGFNSSLERYNEHVKKIYPHVSEMMKLDEKGVCFGICIEGARHILKDPKSSDEVLQTLETFRTKMESKFLTPSLHHNKRLAAHQVEQKTRWGYDKQTDIHSIKDGLHIVTIDCSQDQAGKERKGEGHAILLEIRTNPDSTKSIELFDPNYNIVRKFDSIAKYQEHEKAQKAKYLRETQYSHPEAEHVHIVFYDAQKALEVFYPKGKMLTSAEISGAHSTSIDENPSAYLHQPPPILHNGSNLEQIVNAATLNELGKSLKDSGMSAMKKDLITDLHAPNATMHKASVEKPGR